MRVIEKLFPGDRRNSVFLFILFCLYSLLVCCSLGKHEMWRDEIQDWLLGSNSHSLSEFLANMKKEPNPLLWYFILFLLSKITLNLLIQQVTHILVSIASVYLVLRFSPFEKYQKALFIFGYYFLFEYCIITRGYALTVFSLFLFCSIYTRHPQKYGWLSLAVFLIANSAGGHGIILAISVVVFLVWDVIYSKPAPSKKQPFKAISSFKFPRGFLVAILACCLGIWYAFPTPPEDSVLAGNWYFAWDTERFLRVLNSMWISFVPIPDFNDLHFWNTNLFISHSGSMVFKSMVTIGSAAIIAWCVLLFSKKSSLMIFFLACIGGTLLLFYVNNAIFFIYAMRYHGFSFLGFSCALWILKNPDDGKRITFYSFPLAGIGQGLQALRERVHIEKYSKQVIYGIFSLQFLGGITALYKDYNQSFSGIEKTAAYILEHKLDSLPVAGFVDYAVSPISAFIHKPIYYPDRDVTGTFIKWTRNNYLTDPNQVMNRLLSYISGQKGPVLVILNFELNTPVIGDLTFHHLQSFNGNVVPDENYSLYIASKYDIASVLASVNSSISNDEYAGYISLALGLLQQNNPDDCERLLFALSDKAGIRKLAGVHNVFGQLYFRQLNYPLAKKEFQAEISLNLQKEESYFQLGLLYYQQQKMDSAMLCLEEVTKLNPGNADAFANLGVIYFNFKKDYPRAEEAWRRTIAINPRYFQMYVNLMMNCQLKKDEECLLGYLRAAMANGMSVEEIRSKGIQVSDQLVARAK
jgi:tetratricopeptide (TPR) repeat protein